MAQPQQAMYHGKGVGKSASKGGSKGSGKGKSFANIMKGHWQIKLKGEWKDYGAEEDRILKQAYLVGQPHARFSCRGQNYLYDFREMIQKNTQTAKERTIRPPYGMKAQPQASVPTGIVVVVAAPQGVSSMEIDEGQPGQPISAVVEKQRQHSMSTGSKVAVGAAAVGALAVGGVVLGEHLSDGAISEWATPGLEAAADWAGEAAADVGDWAGHAAADVGDWAAGAADWAGEAAVDASEWAGEAAGDVGEWVSGAAEDVVDWGADAAEDVGDFVMSLF